MSVSMAWTVEATVGQRRTQSRGPAGGRFASAARSPKSVGSDVAVTVIHVVDDNASFRTAVGRLLKASGYHVIGYESASQLLARIPENAGPGCILLDVHMPGMGGLELQDRLSRSGSTLPIVFLTGNEDSATRRRAIDGGASDFLTKPVPRETLLSAIERAIANRRAPQR